MDVIVRNVISGNNVVVFDPTTEIIDRILKHTTLYEPDRNTIEKILSDYIIFKKTYENS